MKSENYLSVWLMILLLSQSMISCAQTQKEKPNKYQEIIKAVKQEFAPDKRVAIFTVDAKASGTSVILKGETNLPLAKKELLARLEKEKVKIEDKIDVLPAQELGEKIYAIVNLSVANIRSNPDYSAELATQALMGMPLNVYKKDDYFYYVQTPDNYLGWVDQTGLTLATKAEFNAWLTSEKVIFTKHFGFVHSKAEENSSTISDIVMGNMLKLNGEEGNFYKVQFPDNREGFVLKSEAQKFTDWNKKTVATAESIINLSKTFIGFPYLWGGTSAKGMDCSGFMKTCHFMHGIILQRDASQQALTGEKIESENGWENFQPGDLLFFGRKATATTKERVTHVGMYIGNSEFIHSSGRVQINSLDKKRANFKSITLVRVSRILNSVDKEGISTFNSNKYYKPIL